MSTLKVTHLQNENGTGPAMSLAVGGGVTFAGITTFHDRVKLGTDIEGHVSADDLTIATSGDTGMTIRSGTSSQGSIYFSDATSGSGEYAGWIRYTHADHNTTIGAGSLEKLRINSIGQVGVGSNFSAFEDKPGITIDSGSGGGSPGIFLKSSGYTGNQTKLWQDSANAVSYLQVTERPLRMEVGNTSSHYIQMDINSAERLKIKGDGVIHINGDATGGRLYATGGALYLQSGNGRQTIKVSDAASGVNRTIEMNSDGNLAFPNGNGIDFSVSAGSGMSAGGGVLDDYEEGTWTPVWTQSGGFTLGNGTLEGTYTKIGRLVYITMRFEVGSTTSLHSSGYVGSISGLPYSIQTATNTFLVSASNSSNNHLGWSNNYSNNTTNLNYIQFVRNGTPNDGLYATSPFTWSTGDDLRMSGSYFTA